MMSNGLIMRNLSPFVEKLGLTYYGFDVSRKESLE